MPPVIPLAEHRKKRQPAPLFFNRQDLNALLAVYSIRVARAEWRDYAIGHAPGMAFFSIFRHTHETPLFTVTKQQVSGRPLYAVFAGDRKLRQSASLASVLAVFDKPIKLIQ